MVYYKKDSVAIRQFIDQNKVKTPKIVFSYRSRSFIGKIHDLIKDAFKKSSDKFFKLISPGEFDKNFEKSKNYSYICPDIRDKFTHLNKYKKTIEMSIGSRVFRIRFVLPIPNIPSDPRVYSNACDIYARRIFIWLYIANEFACNKCSKEIDIFLYFSDEKKILPEVCGDTIDRIHVNTAFTTPCADKTEINVFRSEEWFKVFIHETFHCLGLDFSHREDINEQVSNEIKKKISIDAKLLIYETYSEMWAEIMNIIITISIETHGKHISFVSLVEDMLERELFFSLFQCVKILDHFKMDYENLYLKDQPSFFSLGGVKQYREKTSAFCYFFMKTYLLFNCNMFIEWSLDKNGQSILFKNPETNVRKFVEDLILSKYNDPAFVHCLAQIKSAYFKRKHARSNDFVFKTLRMTANEII